MFNLEKVSGMNLMWFSTLMNNKEDQQDSERVFSVRIELPLELKTATDSLILTLNPPTNVFIYAWYFEYNKNKEINLF